MTNAAAPTTPRPPLQLAPNCIGRTAERIGTIVFVGTVAAPKAKPK